MRKLVAMLFAQLIALASFADQLPGVDSNYIKTHYTKIERMIPMRDGIKLFTSIYIPKDSSEQHPVIITRTPYSVAPYGSEFRKIWETNHGLYAMKNYFIVMQDVRGRYMSEGKFEDVRPFNATKSGQQADEASDTYDTIEWLLQNLKGNNGRVGAFGISYPGFYSTMAALSAHPALKAVSPQAPVTEWFIGDDFHHNGAFMLIDAFEFYTGFGVPRPKPLKTYNTGYERKEKDAYKFYLEAGALSNYNKKFLGDSIAFWNDLMQHPNYDAWWQARNTRNHVGGLNPAMLVVGGNFDAEDCYGAWNLYKAIEAKNPASLYNKIVMGPWFHGAWGGRSTGYNLGDAKFGSNTSYWYQQAVEVPFFETHLRPQSAGAANKIAEATIFFTGENSWKTFEQWPPANATETALYLQPRNRLAFKKPAAVRASSKPSDQLSYTQYVSDPAKPVPHEGSDTITARTREYMSADQRFASKRNDVLTFTLPVQKDTLRLGGTISADLMISMDATDADFVVKLIDVLPNNVSSKSEGADTVYLNNSKMNGYQMLIRGEIMRGKFRNSFEEPEAFVPNKITRVRFDLPDIAHTFLPGHQVMIQIQSSWFPLADRNPQQFMNIYEAKDEDFKKATIRIYHTDGLSSKILLPVMK